jgi:O-antigen/teichoic acid export membrane protein
MNPSVEPLPASTAPAPARSSSGRTVARNTMMLVLAQALGIPLSMVLNAVMARKLGPEGLGHYYLATTFAGYAFLFVEWGLGSLIPRKVAQQRDQAGAVLGGALLWRIGSAPVFSGVLILIAAVVYHVWGVQKYNGDFQIALVLACAGSALCLWWRTCGDVVRGFERADVSATSQVTWQIINAILMTGVLVAGGNLHLAMAAGVLAAALPLVPVWRSLKGVGIGRLTVDVANTRSLLKEAVPFLMLSLILASQPNIDAAFLSVMSSDKVLGWHAAAKKLVGVLVTPAGALIGALYPTLSRLYTESQDEYRKTARSAIRASVAMTMPLAVSCVMYAEIGIRLFNKESFAPAEQNLQILSLFVMLMYVTMTMGCILAAAGRQRPWTAVAFACVVVTLIADPLLIPYFQRRYGNGALGANIANVANELVMLFAGIWLAPAGVFDRSVARGALACVVAGGVMAGVARVLSGLSPYLAAPIAIAAYAVALYALGGIEKELVTNLRSTITRKLGRR